MSLGQITQPGQPAAPAPSLTGTPQDPNIMRLMQQGYTGPVGQGGQIVQMTNGQLPSATPATPAATPGASAGGAAAAAPPAPTGGFLGAGQGAGPGAMNPWSNWMTSGGVNPQGWQNTGGTDPSQWQSLGGGPNLGFLQQFQSLLSGGANPTTVDPTSASGMYGAAQPYADQAYQAATRELDPQTQAQNAQFEQQMVNQGIAPGSAAYDQAKQQMSMSQNDAYNQARTQAQTTGLAAQGQGFGQGLAQSQLANTLAGQLLGSNTSIANQQLGGNASVMNQLLGGNAGLMGQLLNGNSGIAQQLIGGQATMNAAGSAAGASRANSMNNYNLGMSQLAQTGQQQDFSNLMSMLGLGMGTTQYNNGLLNQDQQNAQSFFGYMPQGGGGNIDVTGPYGQQLSQQNAQYGANQQNANGTNSALMSMAMMAMLCDRNAKVPTGEIDHRACLGIIEALPIERWQYKHDGSQHIGTYAQDFNKAAGLPPSDTISIQSMLGAMIGSIKSLAEDMRDMRRQIASPIQGAM